MHFLYALLNIIIHYLQRRICLLGIIDMIGAMSYDMYIVDGVNDDWLIVSRDC